MSTVPKSEHERVLGDFLASNADDAPSHIFALETRHSAKWEENRKREGGKTLFAFHGSKVENFHSILSHGLQQHLTTVRSTTFNI